MKSRKDTDGDFADPVGSVRLPRGMDPVETVRKQARHRLIGALVLVVVAVLALPPLLETKPRPIALESTPMEVINASGKSASSANVRASGLSATESIVSPSLPPPLPSIAPPHPPPPPPTPAQETTAEKAAKEKIAKEKAAKEKAAKEAKEKAEKEKTAKTTKNKSPETIESDRMAAEKGLPITNTKIIVQVGSYDNAEEAQTVRLQLQKAGIKNYTHIAKTPKGDVTRVRVGPYKDKVTADNIADKIRKMGYEPGLYWLDQKP